MKDKEWTVQKKKVAGLFKKWIEILGLKWYEIDIEYKTGEGEDRGEGFFRCAEVKSRWMYRSAVITVWLEAVPENEYKLEKMIVHELCHILVEQMRVDGVVTDNEEAVVEGLARAFLWVKESNKKKKRK